MLFAQPLKATVEPPQASDLVRRASRGDVAAFDELVATRLGASLRLARAIVDSPADAEDRQDMRSHQVRFYDDRDPQVIPR